MTTLMLLAILGTGQTADTGKASPAHQTVAPENAWLDDYGVALEQTKKLGKPLLMVIDTPSNAAARMQQISYRTADGTSTESNSANLLKYYVLCRVDASTKYGQAVAEAFKTSTLPHTAIIDKRGKHILFRKAGQFGSAEWTSTLTSYWRGERLVTYQASASNSYQPSYSYQPRYSSPSAGCST
jgi:hypothetical protein